MKNKDLFDLIFSKNVNADLEDWSSYTPLCYALEEKNEKAISELQLRTQKYNLNALICAIKTENISAIQWFFQKGFLPQIKTDEGEIMSAVAEQTRNTEIIKLFLSNGLDVNASNKIFETALLVAIKNKNLDSAKYLILNNADITKGRETIWEYLDWNNKDLINLIMCKNINPELPNRFNLTPLFYAIYYRDLDSVTFLLFFYNLNISKLFNYDLFTISEILKQKDLTATSEALKQFGNILKSRNSAFKNVDDLYIRLHFAVYLGNVTEIENLTEEESIDFESVDKYNQILPLHFTVKGGVLDLKLLKEKTEWIRSIYKENTMWSLEDIREYLVDR